jgi:hypothetical protein
MDEEREKDNEKESDEEKNDPSTRNSSSPKTHAHTTPVQSADLKHNNPCKLKLLLLLLLVVVLPTPLPAGVPDTGLLYMQLAVSLAAAFRI